MPGQQIFYLKHPAIQGRPLNKVLDKKINHLLHQQDALLNELYQLKQNLQKIKNTPLDIPVKKNSPIAINKGFAQALVKRPGINANNG